MKKFGSWTNIFCSSERKTQTFRFVVFTNRGEHNFVFSQPGQVQFKTENLSNTVQVMDIWVCLAPT